MPINVKGLFETLQYKANNIDSSTSTAEILDTLKAIKLADGNTIISYDSDGVLPDAATSNFKLAYVKSTGIIKFNNGTWDTLTGSLSAAVDPAEVAVLLVAGGGGGGGSPHGGGGGAGGVVYVPSMTLSSGTTYTITVGDGGTGYTGTLSSPWPSPGTNKGSNGENTTAFGLTAIGGGGGGGYSGGGANDTPGQDGGSGGGGTDESAAGSATQTSPTDPAGTGYGNDGGTSTNNTYSKGGGGAGEQGDTDGDGYGGDGVDMSAIFGTSVGESGVFGGGGGGSFYNASGHVGTGGDGGGGDGASSSASPYSPGNGTANTGGGGGGAERNASGTATGGTGGSGVVLVKTTSTAASTTGSPTLNTFNGYNVYTFTASGSITF